MWDDRLDMKVLKRLLTADHSGSLWVHKHKEGRVDVTNRSDLNICHGWTKISFFHHESSHSSDLPFIPIRLQASNKDLRQIVCACVFFVFYLLARCEKGVEKRTSQKNTVVSSGWEVHDAPAVTVAQRGKRGSPCAWCAHFPTEPCLVSH